MKRREGERDGEGEGERERMRPRRTTTELRVGTVRAIGSRWSNTGDKQLGETRLLTIAFLATAGGIDHIQLFYTSQDLEVTTARPVFLTFPAKEQQRVPPIPYRWVKYGFALFVSVM